MLLYWHLYYYIIGNYNTNLYEQSNNNQFFSLQCLYFRNVCFTMYLIGKCRIIIFVFRLGIILFFRLCSEQREKIGYVYIMMYTI